MLTHALAEILQLSADHTYNYSSRWFNSAIKRTTFWWWQHMKITFFIRLMRRIIITRIFIRVIFISLIFSVVIRIFVRVFVWVFVRVFIGVVIRVFIGFIIRIIRVFKLFIPFWVLFYSQYEFTARSISIIWRKGRV